MGLFSILFSWLCSLQVGSEHARRVKRNSQTESRPGGARGSMECRALPERPQPSRPGLAEAADTTVAKNYSGHAGSRIGDLREPVKTVTETVAGATEAIMRVGHGQA